MNDNDRFWSVNIVEMLIFYFDAAASLSKITIADTWAREMSFDRKID